VTIGTGGVTGIYYPTGGAISRMVNKKFDEYGIKATVESTSGSVFNINTVINGDLEFGVVQSDRQYQAYNGLAEWSESGRQTELRAVFSVHPESITLIASEKSDIRGIKDLKGKRVNLGNPGSGQLQNSKDVLKAAGVAEEDFSAEYVKAVEAPGLLQDGRLDAFFYTVGHPNGNIKEATAGRIKVFIISIKGRDIDEMLKKYPYYSKSTIPHSFYPYALNTEDVETFYNTGQYNNKSSSSGFCHNTCIPDLPTADQTRIRKRVSSFSKLYLASGLYFGRPCMFFRTIHCA